MLEHKMLNLYRSEFSAFKQQLERYEQSKNRFDNEFRSFRSEMSDLKKTVDKVQGEYLILDLHTPCLEFLNT
jgi:hypothetical protein